jgi:hypothetical protein
VLLQRQPAVHVPYVVALKLALDVQTINLARRALLLVRLAPAPRERARVNGARRQCRVGQPT